ncbi:Dolichyldiphosphatase 1 [Entomortierella lignicola]|nr:Dolichyldiphosphatase 1 [Entomortierella lignicola]
MFSDKGSSSVLRNRNLIAASVLTKSVSAATSNAPIVESASKFPPHHTLTSLSLTHVQFTQNDIVSKLLAYVTLTPLGIICGYVAVISTSRDLKPLVMLGGQLANEVLNLILKRIVKQARPTGNSQDLLNTNHLLVRLTDPVLRPLGLLEWIVDHPWAKQLHVRDTDAIPDLAKYDWEMWQQFRRSEHEKKE